MVKTVEDMRDSGATEQELVMKLAELEGLLLSVEAGTTTLTWDVFVQLKEDIGWVQARLEEARSRCSRT